MKRARRKSGTGANAATTHPALTRAAAVAGAPARGVPWWLVALILALPLVLVIGYGSLTSLLPGGTTASPHAAGFGSAAPARGPGAPGARAPAAGPAPGGQGASESAMPPDIEPMVERLAKRLESQPDDAKGWKTLAHSYYALKRFPEAVKAYESLLKISAPDAGTLADYADALAMAQGRSLSGKPMELIREALKLDPAQWKALSMAATEAFARKDYSTAIAYWERALAAVPPGSEIAQAVQANIAEARKLGSGN